jgi:CheY-like chemotaxis protein
MNVKTCLLVTDDPDDHQSFSEALSEISANTILIVILDSEKATMLLESKKLIPDYIFVDLSMHGIHIREFMEAVKRDGSLRTIPAILYGDEDELNKIQQVDSVPFFPKDYNYAELRSFLMDVVQP